LPAGREQRPTNVYVLRGDFWGRRSGTYARAAATPGITSASSSQTIKIGLGPE
jgi:hypothetical protein